jgi:hypothetical protein
MKKFRLATVGFFLFLPFLCKTVEAAVLLSTSSNLSSSPAVPTLLRLVTNQPNKPVNKPKPSVTPKTSSKATNTIIPTTSHVPQYYYKIKHIDTESKVKVKGNVKEMIISKNVITRSERKETMNKFKKIIFLYLNDQGKSWKYLN